MELDIVIVKLITRLCTHDIIQSTRETEAKETGTASLVIYDIRSLLNRKHTCERNTMSK